MSGFVEILVDSNFRTSAGNSHTSAGNSRSPPLSLLCFQYTASCMRRDCSRRWPRQPTKTNTA